MRRRKRNPQKWTWREVALAWELEGTRPTFPKDWKFAPLRIFSQALPRKELTESICQTLKNAGLPVYTRKEKERTLTCEVKVLEAQLCISKRMLPHLRTQDRREALTRYIKELEKPPPPKRKPRKPVPCPLEL